MSIPTAACCTVTLRQQQEQAIHHQDQCQDAVNPCKEVRKSCTVVENGRVVVKPVEPSVQS